VSEGNLGYWKDYQEKLTKDRKGHKENQDELGTEVSKEDKAPFPRLLLRLR
jgi:hypothetical protein